MFTLKKLPENVMNFLWKPYIIPPAAPVAPPAPYSRQGLLLFDGIPDGAAIAAGGGGAPDALRGWLSLWWSWKGIPDTARTLNIAFYKTGDTVDPLSIANPANALLGGTSLIAGAADDQATVALNFREVLRTWLTNLGVYGKFLSEKGAVLTVTPPLHAVEVLLVLPGPAKVTYATQGLDVANGIFLNSVIRAPYVRPIFPAGFHPGPWEIISGGFDGYGVDRGAE